MINDHAFKPAPGYPDRCDAKLQAHPAMGGVVTCGQPGREHDSCAAQEGHYAEKIVDGFGKPHFRCKECLMFMGDAPIVTPPLDKAEAPAPPPVPPTTDLALACAKAYRVLDRSAGGCVAEAKAILKSALDAQK